MAETDSAETAPTEETATVVFTPSGLRGQFVVGTSVLQAAQSLGVDLESSCGGRGLCGRCQVIPSLGQFPKHQITVRPEHLSSISDFERSRAKVLKLTAERRLGCQARIDGDLVVEVPADSQLHQQRISKKAEQIDLTPDPAVRLYVVSVEQPDMHKPASDFKRLQQALEREHGVKASSCDLELVQSLQDTLRQGNWVVTVAVYRQQLVQAVWPGFKEFAYGLVVDLGSTTIAAHLCELSGGQVVATAAIMNPQIRFGEDLMSRVSYVMMNEGGDQVMTQAVRQSFNQLAEVACNKADLKPADILEMTVVGNPVMHHLFLGIDPTPLGSAPFALSTEGTMVLRTSELGIDLHPQARACILPCIAGHIGADMAGVILAQKPWLSDKVNLLVDIGTNAEIVLGNKHRMLAASSPTGPAFEGAQISCGQRAAPGAIERVRIDRQTLEPRFKVIGCDLWSDEPGFKQAVESTGVTGICGSGIIEVVAEMYLSGIVNQDGVILPGLSTKTNRVIEDGRTYSYILFDQGADLRITQNDVRAIQLAKAALYAGIKLLLEKLGIERPDTIAIAGAFGSHIDVTYATVLGLIPDCPLSSVASVGNAASTGARIALLDVEQRDSLETILSRVEKIETAVEPKFQEHFVNAMAIPNKSDSFDNLRREIQLPAPIQLEAPARQNARAGARRRRRR